MRSAAAIDSMLSISAARRRRLCAEWLAAADAMIGFADVGSGGPLKRPWSLLPAARLRRFEFEPTSGSADGRPVCVSNRAGEAQFHIARDERASSFHRALPQFAERYGMQSLYPTRSMTVRCITLDEYFAGRYEEVDALDVNVEGHDFQALQGGMQLLRAGGLKLLKVEFELAAVWEGQGWLSDIDPLLRNLGYELTGMEVEFARPLSVRHCFHRGEPLWGKALYAPGSERWRELLERTPADGAARSQAAAKGMALYLAADLPGRALDLAQLHAGGAPVRGVFDPRQLRARISAAYRWAKLERGAQELWRLMAGAVGARRPLFES